MANVDQDKTLGIGAAQESNIYTSSDNEKTETAHAIAEGGDADNILHAGLQNWNNPRVNIFRFVAINFTFINMGIGDACFGALLPYIERYYGINYITVASIFISPFPGIMIASLTNNWLHYKLGQRGVAFIGPISRLVGFFPLAFHPPFPVIPCVLTVAGFGFGICDGSFNAWVSGLHSPNELLGILHGSYSLGAMISPLIATAMVVRAGLPWYTFFYMLLALIAVEFVVVVFAFWDATAAVYRQRLDHDTQGHSRSKKARVTTRQVLRTPIPWLFALFLFAYQGAEVSLGGWMPTFMLQVRKAEAFMSGLTVTLFWLGLLLGRVILGFVTGRIGEKMAITTYLALCVVFQVLYWLIPHYIASVVFVILLGFFLGPLFPAIVVMAAKLLPAEQHVSAIGFASAAAGGGGALFPFAIGAAAEKHGVEVLQPFVVAMLVFISGVWLVLPGGMRKGGLEKARERGTKPGEDLVKLMRNVIRR